MPSLLTQKPAGSGNWYLNYKTERPGGGKPMQKTVPLRRLGDLDEGQRAIIAAVFEAGGTAYRPKRGRPKKGAAVPAPVPQAAPAPASPSAPEGMEPVTPEDAVEGLVDSMEGRAQPNTIVARKSCLEIMMAEFGSQSWDGWSRFWSWLFATYPNEHTRQSFITAANKIIKWGRRPDVMKHVPNFKPEEARPVPTKREKRRHRLASKAGEPYSLPQMKAQWEAFDAAGLPLYMRLVEAVMILTGLAPIDARNLLTCRKPKQGDGFTWNAANGVVWYRGWRQKTDERIDIPLAPTLVDLLRPYQRGTHGIDIGVKMPGDPTQYRKWHQRLEIAAGLTPMKGQGLKRMRTGFQVVLQEDLSVSEPVRKRLMGHKINGKTGPALQAYMKARQQDTIKAIQDYDALFQAAKAGQE